MPKPPNIFKRVKRKTKAEKIKDQLALLKLCSKDVEMNYKEAVKYLKEMK